MPGTAKTRALARAIAKCDWRAAAIALMLFFLIGYILSFLVAGEIQKQTVESVESDVTGTLVPRLLGQLRPADFQQEMAPERTAEIQSFMNESIIGKKIVGVRIWDARGAVVFETITSTFHDDGHSETGANEHLSAALRGSPSSNIERADPTTRGYTPDLIETYAPIRFEDSGEIAGAFEIYEDYSMAASHVAAIQRLTTWGLVGGLAAAYLLLMGFTQRSHSLILRQHSLLEEQRDDLQGANLRLTTSEERFRALVQNVSDVILVVDGAANIKYASPSARPAWRRSPENLQNTCLYDLMNSEDEAAANEAFSRVRFASKAHTKLSFLLDKGTAYEKAIEANITNLTNQPGVDGIVLSCRDVTDRQRYEQGLADLAYRDTLTGLPNRRQFIQDLESSAALIDQANLLALILVDLDRFKSVNDSHGHPAGDALLVEVADRLVAALPEARVGRLGGDEFAVMVRVRDEAEAAAIAERIMSRFGVPFRYDGKSVTITVSLGVAIADDTISADRLVRSADVAMYRSKAAGGNAYIVANRKMEEDWLRRQELETDLRGIVERGELRLHYQPIIDLKSGDVRGMEALVRWQHPTCGLISPGEFISLAESTGHILQIGRWVRETAFNQAKTWTDRYPRLADFRIRINMSAVELEQDDLVWSVAGALRDSGLDPDLVEIEVTESVVMRDPVEMSGRLRELANLGITMAIDDFGTGYSSLGYLRLMPVGTLKIDRSFVMDLTNDRISQTLIEAMVVLGRTLGFDVVAEGVETVEQQSILIQLGCQLGQGYLFARPMDTEAADAALEATSAGPAVHWRAAGA